MTGNLLPVPVLTVLLFYDMFLSSWQHNFTSTKCEVMLYPLIHIHVASPQTDCGTGGDISATQDQYPR